MSLNNSSLSKTALLAYIASHAFMVSSLFSTSLLHLLNTLPLTESAEYNQRIFFSALCELSKKPATNNIL